MKSNLRHRDIESHSLRSVNPLRCRMWHLHDRLGEEISPATCASLIESIGKHGQKHPALGRALHEDDQYDVELIYGARRLFATRHLGVDLLVQVREIDDQAAILEMDIENRVRRDISPYERGLSYRAWLRKGLFASQSDLASGLGVSEAQVSRLLRYAALPAVVVEAFSSPRDIREQWAVELAKCCEQPSDRARLSQRARHYLSSGKRVPAQSVYDLLTQVNRKISVRISARDEVVKDSSGTRLMRVSIRAKNVHLILDREALSNSVLSAIKEEITNVLKTTLPSSSGRTDVVPDGVKIVRATVSVSRRRTSGKSG